MKTLLEIRDFVNWVFHYKTIKNEYEEEIHQGSLDLIRANKKIKEKDQAIKNTESLVTSRNAKIKELNDNYDKLKNHVSEIEKLNNKLRSNIESYKLEKKELVKEISNLTIELENTKNQLESTSKRLDYCKTHRRAPSKEEILAYDYSRKEVLKRSKESK